MHVCVHNQSSLSDLFALVKSNYCTASANRVSTLSVISIFMYRVIFSFDSAGTKTADFIFLNIHKLVANLFI